MQCVPRHRGERSSSHGEIGRTSVDSIESRIVRTRWRIREKREREKEETGQKLDYKEMNQEI